MAKIQWNKYNTFKSILSSKFIEIKIIKDDEMKYKKTKYSERK